MPGVLLGSIQFVDREVPDTIKWGGKQMLAIHRVMGGNRVIDAIGPDPEPVAWSGLFYGSSASQRARACDELRKSGAEVTLSWGTFNYLVVVSDFGAVYKHEWEVRYHISCEVISDLNNATIGISLDSIFSNDFADIFAIANAVPGVPALAGAITIPATIVSSITTAQAAINTAVGNGSISDVSLTELRGAIVAAQAAFAALSAGSGTPGGVNLDAITGASTIDGTKSFVTEAGLVAAESDIQTALAYLGRIVGNLTTMGG